GKWAVVTGNGYSSLNDKAALLIIDLETGALTRKLEVTGRTGVPNGLSSPRLADNNSDGVADYADAGDLQGNLWRFDLIAGKVNQ
ncbi:pilus assembly protein, partial [Listeria monocytogenes]|nr:pilus assembly protein [Listeria monocytogenes]